MINLIYLDGRLIDKKELPKNAKFIKREKIKSKKNWLPDTIERYYELKTKSK